MAALWAKLPVCFLGQIGQFLVTFAQTTVLFLLASYTQPLLAERAFGVRTLDAHLRDKGITVLIRAV
jgi:hypothetical protein